MSTLLGTLSFKIVSTILSLVVTVLSAFAFARLEFKGKIKNDTVSIFDDYAHHPTEITATANAIKNKKYNESWVIFQPHTYSRTKLLLDDFAKSVSLFDNIIILDIYAARETDTLGISSVTLKEEIEKFEEGYDTIVGERGTTLLNAVIIFSSFITKLLLAIVL